MIRLAWRQFRLQAVIATGLLALFAIVMVATGPHLAHLYATTVAPCARANDCSLATNALLARDHFLQAGLPPVLLLLPALIGVFWGAPLVARELETGTYRVAWTQSVTRRRWLLTRLGLVGAAAMVVAGLFSLGLGWWFSPIDEINLNRMTPAMFGLRGITPIGYAAFAFALGVTLGVLVRRTVPAMALTLVGFLAARLAVAFWVRPHLASPLRAMTPLTLAVGNGPGAGPGSAVIPAGSWVLADETLAANGRVIGENGGLGPNGSIGFRVGSNGVVSIPGVGSCPSVRLQAPGPGRPLPQPGSPGIAHAFNACARHLGLHELVTYQPASRYWPFQWYETGIFLALALVVAGIGYWWLVGRDGRMRRGGHPRARTAALRRVPGSTPGGADVETVVQPGQVVSLNLARRRASTSRSGGDRGSTASVGGTKGTRMAFDRQRSTDRATGFAEGQAPGR